MLMDTGIRPTVMGMDTRPTHMATATARATVMAIIGAIRTMDIGATEHTRVGIGVTGTVVMPIGTSMPQLMVPDFTVRPRLPRRAAGSDEEKPWPRAGAFSFTFVTTNHAHRPPAWLVAPLGGAGLFISNCRRLYSRRLFRDFVASHCEQSDRAAFWRAD